MKLTTKIILSIFGSIFFITLLFIIGFSFSERRNYKTFHFNVISIPQDSQIGINLAPPYHVIVFEEEETEIQAEHVYFSENNYLNVCPITTTEEENKLFIPEALNGFISAKTDNDTLRIKIKVGELRKKYDEEDGTHPLLSDVHLYLHTSHVDVINHMSGIQTKVINMETDTIKIYSTGNILIDSCKANVIDPVTRNSLSVTNSTVKVINLDFNRISRWSITDCDIETKNMTGSDRHHITLHRSETGKINWYPKNEKAELNIKVPGDTTQIVYR